MYPHGHLLFACLLQLLAESEAVDCLEVLFEECLHLGVQLSLHLRELPIEELPQLRALDREEEGLVGVGLDHGHGVHGVRYLSEDNRDIR